MVLEETVTQTAEYGRTLAEQIRATADYANLSDFEKFVLNNGWKFKTEEALKAGYDRLCKSGDDILLIEEEFVIEAGDSYDVGTLKAVYAVLLQLVDQKKLSPFQVYNYANLKWCLSNPEAIIAYQEGRNRWMVNNCEAEITIDAATIAINREWGFEASRVRIIGTPYYESTDWQFIRFDCASMSWLWRNESLYQVYE